MLVGVQTQLLLIPSPVPQLWNVELDEAPVALALSPKQQLLAVATVDDSIQRACSGRSAALCPARVVPGKLGLHAPHIP